MRFGFVTSSVVCLASSLLFAAGSERNPASILASAPLRFEPAAGNDNGQFLARGPHFRYAFTARTATLHAGPKTVRLEFADASATAQLQATGRLASTSNVFHGNDPSQWRTSIPNYGRLEVHGIYRGVDLAYYGNGHELEYDVVVKPGADPNQVRLRFEGVDPRIDRQGNLTAGIVQKRPFAYQIAAAGTRIPVETRYRRNADGTFSFLVRDYDRSRDLIIDPVLTMSYYFGGGQQDSASAIGHDAPGFIYVAGTTYSSDFSATDNAVSGTLGGTSDAFFVKIDPNAAPGSQVIVATYLGGSGNETLNDMVVTGRGAIYLTGTTSSTDFPAVNPAQSALNGSSDAFVMWLDPAQSGGGMIVYSTYLGGSGDDAANGIAVDANGRIFITGTTHSSDFPIAGGFQSVKGGDQTAFVAGFDSSQANTATLIYSTYLGGVVSETGRGIAAAPDGTIWVVGGTYSSDFPLTGYSYKPVYQPGGDAYMAQINPGIGGSGGLLYASFLGGSGTEEAKKILIDPRGHLIIAGETGSQDFPATSNAMQAIYGGNFDVFVAIFDPKNITSDRSAQLLYATFFGGSQPEVPYDMKLDSNGNLYLTGFTMSPDLPTTGNAIQPRYDTSSRTLDGFALEFNPSRQGLGAMEYSSYIHSVGMQISYGIDYDSKGNIYVAGSTTGPIFDAFSGAPRSTTSGNTDAFLMGFSACAFVLSKSSEQFSAGGGSDSITVAASTPNCPWTTSSPANWITFSAASGIGSGSLTITAAANDTGAPRTTTVTIAGVQVTVAQD